MNLYSIKRNPEIRLRVGIVALSDSPFRLSPILGI